MDKKDIGKTLALLVMATMVFAIFSGCIGEEKETPAPTTAAPTTSERAFMADPAVRKAIAYCFDYEATIKDIYNGYAIPLPGPIPKGFPCYESQYEYRYSLDLDKAEEILDAAGYTKNEDGYRFDGVPIRIYYNAGNEERAKMSMMLQGNLAKIGIVSQVMADSWPSLLHRMFKTTDWDLMYCGWAPDYIDPDNYIFSFCASADIGGDIYNTGWKNERVDELLTNAKFEPDLTKRCEMYREAWEIIIDDPAHIWACQPQHVHFEREWVHGYEYNPCILWRYYNYYKEAEETGTTVKNPDTIVRYTIGDAKNLDPADSYDTASWEIVTNVYDTLVTVKGSDAVTIEPDLATDWSVSEDGLVWTFHLRKGVKFSNGNDFTADDVVYSFDRVLTMNSPESGCAWILSQFLRVGDTVKVDDYTVELHLEKSFGITLPCLVTAVASIVDSDYVEAHGGVQADTENEFMKENPMGTGPYMLESWTRKQEIRLVKNPNYWGGWEGKHVSNVIIKIVEEPSTRILALKNGDADFADIPTANIEDVKDAPGVRMELAPSPNVTMLHIQTKPT